jgi:hypothetical protein
VEADQRLPVDQGVAVPSVVRLIPCPAGQHTPGLPPLHQYLYLKFADQGDAVSLIGEHGPREAARVLGISIVTIGGCIGSAKIEAALASSTFGESCTVGYLPLLTSGLSDDMWRVQPAINSVE